jgi:hypothetical protein
MRRDLLVGGPIEILPEPIEPHPRSSPDRATAASALMNRCRRSGESSPTGIPFLVRTNDSPWSSWRIISPLLLHSSRWLICLATPGA